MDKSELVGLVNASRDSSGVITSQGAANNLSMLTPDDWYQAAAIYKKDPAKPDGFYITDSDDGKVVIHNDLSLPRKVADTPLWDAFKDKVLHDGNIGFGEAAFGVMGGLGVLAGTITLPEVAIALAGVAAVGMTVDAATNYFDKNTAKADLRGNPELKIDGNTFGCAFTQAEMPDRC
jgi:hypothetical protein